MYTTLRAPNNVRAIFIAVLTFVAGVFLTSWTPRQAEAKQSEAYAYTYNQVWTTAVRLIRVDLGYAITENDEGSGYLLFEHLQGDKKTPGSVEFVTDVSKRVVHVALHIPAMPTYVERMLLDRLARKLKEEYGDPASLIPSSDPKKAAAADKKKKATSPAKKG